MKSIFIRASVLTLSLSAGAVLAAGCSSSNNNGGGGGTSNTDYCSILNSYISTCKPTDPCELAIAKNCSTYIASFSSAYLAAETSCQTSDTCSDAGSSAADACVQAKLATLTPSSAQTKLATDYCGSCAAAGQTSSACVTSFYGSTGVGTEFLIFNDSIVTSIDTKCVPPAAGDDAGVTACFTYEACLEEAAEAALNLPAACTTVDVDGG